MGFNRCGGGDHKAGGMIVCGTSDVSICGNVFSGVRPKALTVEGEASKRVVFANNVLADVESDHAKLDASSLVNDLEPVK